MDRGAPIGLVGSRKVTIPYARIVTAASPGRDRFRTDDVAPRPRSDAICPDGGGTSRSGRRRADRCSRRRRHRSEANATSPVALGVPHVVRARQGTACPLTTSGRSSGLMCETEAMTCIREPAMRSARTFDASGSAYGRWVPLATRAADRFGDVRGRPAGDGACSAPACGEAGRGRTVPALSSKTRGWSRGWPPGAWNLSASSTVGGMRTDDPRRRSPPRSRPRPGRGPVGPSLSTSRPAPDALRAASPQANDALPLPRPADHNRA